MTDAGLKEIATLKNLVPHLSSSIA